jgi:hypothetical protein
MHGREGIVIDANEIRQGQDKVYTMTWEMPCAYDRECEYWWHVRRVDDDEKGEGGGKQP